MGTVSNNNHSTHQDQQHNTNMSETDDIIKRIQQQPGVQGTIIFNNDGIAIRTTLDNTTTVQYSGLLHSLTNKARSVIREIDPQNDLTFLRIRTKKTEFMLAPDKDYNMVVIQNPTTNI